MKYLKIVVSTYKCNLTICYDGDKDDHDHHDGGNEMVD